MLPIPENELKTPANTLPRRNISISDLMQAALLVGSGDLRISPVTNIAAAAPMSCQMVYGVAVDVTAATHLGHYRFHPQVLGIDIPRAGYTVLRFRRVSRQFDIAAASRSRPTEVLHT